MNLIPQLMKAIPLKTGLVAALLLVCAAARVVIANNDVPAGSLSADELKDIYTGKTGYWQGGQRVVIAVLADGNDAALKKVSGMDASQFKTFWQRLVFSGRGQLPKKADDAASLVALVARTQGAIALVPADAGLMGVKILEVK
jgi:ABC-type phosphate transport system substrate-binding protein